MKAKHYVAVLSLAALTLMPSVMHAAAAKIDPATYPSVAQVEAGLKKEQGTIFPIGKPNVNYDTYFTGKTFLAPLGGENIGAANVTFTKGAHTFWHIHRGSCQILVPESGRGYYQIWGQKAVELKPGMVATIPEGTKHWHGASKNSMMQHLSIMESKGVKTEWLEEVDQKEYDALK